MRLAALVPRGTTVAVATDGIRTGDAMNVRRWKSWVGVLVVLAAGPAAGRPGDARPVAPPVEDLVTRALEQSPSLAALRARLSSSRHRVAPAGALPDPMLAVMYQDVGAPWNPDRAMSMVQVEYTQPLPYLGKLQARRDAATAEADVGEADIRLLKLRLAASIRALYARVYAIDREADALEAAAQLLDLAASTVSARYAAGLADQEALVKVRLEGSRLAGRRTDLEAERAEQAAELSRLLGEPGAPAIGEVSSLPPVKLPDGSLEDLAVANCCRLAVARAAVVAAERKVEAARLEGRPNFLLGVAGGTTLGPEAVITLRFGIELPAFAADKQDALLSAAAADLEAARHEERAAEDTVRSEAATLAARWKRADAQVTLFREAIVPQASVAMDAARAAYTAGRGDFSTLIEDFRIWVDAQLDLSRREADRYSTWADVQELVTPAVQPTAEGEGR